MGVAGKWSRELVLTVVVAALAVGVVPSSAAAAEAPPAVSAEQPAQPVMEPAPAVVAASAPVAEQSAPMAESSSPPAEQSAPVADSGGPVTMQEVARPSAPTATDEPAAARAAPQPSARPGRAAPMARPGRVQEAHHGARVGTAQSTGSEPDSSDHVPACTQTGTAGDDTIDGTAGDDVICGGDGNDVIHGGGGDDVIDGGGGDDQIFGGPGNDTINGGEGSDTIDGQGGDDVLDAGAGDDFVNGEDPSGNSGKDQISCGDGRDEYVSSAEDTVAVDCESRPPGGDVNTHIQSGGGANDPARVGSALALVGPALAEARRHPVAVTQRNLVVEKGQNNKRMIRFALVCKAGSERQIGHVTLTATGRGRTKLATATFRCDQVGPMVVTLRPTRALERLLQDHDAVDARVRIRIRHRTVLARVTITQG